MRSRPNLHPEYDTIFSNRRISVFYFEKDANSDVPIITDAVVQLE